MHHYVHHSYPSAPTPQTLRLHPAPALLSQSAIIAAYMDVINGLAGGDPLVPQQPVDDYTPVGTQPALGGVRNDGRYDDHVDDNDHCVADIEEGSPDRRAQSFEGECNHDR
jgi:hypothetical protein